MKKTKVVIASILKPIDDTRMFEKFGLSMVETNKYEVNIIGFDSKNARAVDDIVFHPIKPFNRISFTRLVQPFKTFKKYIKVKPEVIIVNTHELLLVTYLYRILFGGKFIYDIRENYVKNIRNTSVFPYLLRAPLAFWVWAKEWVCKPFIDHYFLAERIYKQQLSFLSQNHTIIENKYAPLSNETTAFRNPDPENIDLVYTGTISESNGIFDAIEVAKKLHHQDARIKLKIVGYCALKKDLLRLQEEIEDLDFIELNGGDHLVPHSEILEAIQKADFGLVLKKPNNGTNDEKILTRLFEYTANQLPILLLNNPHWVSFCEQFNAGIVIAPDQIDPSKLLDQMSQKEFYSKGDTSSSLWNSEIPKLLDALSQLE